MGKALKEAFANEAEDTKFRISKDPCIPVLAKPTCKRLPDKCDFTDNLHYTFHISYFTLVVKVDC